MAEASSAFSNSFVRFREKSYNKHTDDKLKEEGEKILEKYAPKKSSPVNVHSVFWMIASIAVFYYTDFYLALRYDRRIHRPYFYGGSALISLSTIIGFILVGYYHYFLGITDYEKHQPYAVPIATISFILGMIILCFALWPVWSIFTPFILFTQFMGFVFFFTIIPV